MVLLLCYTVGAGSWSLELGAGGLILKDLQPAESRNARKRPDIPEQQQQQQ
jgi:hypothetical protein